MVNSILFSFVENHILISDIEMHEIFIRSIFLSACRIKFCFEDESCKMFVANIVTLLFHATFYQLQMLPRQKVRLINIQTSKQSYVVFSLGLS